MQAKSQGVKFGHTSYFWDSTKQFLAHLASELRGLCTVCDLLHHSCYFWKKMNSSRQISLEIISDTTSVLLLGEIVSCQHSLTFSSVSVLHGSRIWIFWKRTCFHFCEFSPIHAVLVAERCNIFSKTTICIYAAMKKEQSKEQWRKRREFCDVVTSFELWNRIQVWAPFLAPIWRDLLFWIGDKTNLWERRTQKKKTKVARKQTGDSVCRVETELEEFFCVFFFQKG